MSTKLGLHITPGSRDGYGPVTAAAPAVVLAVGDSAPLREAKEKSGGRTITIFRDINVYENGNAPPGFPEMTEAEARAAADRYWPSLRASYQAHDADYYQPTNEIAGGLEDPVGSKAFETGLQSVRNLIAYETRLMELAEADGIKLAVASLAGGTPGKFELWKEWFVPLIRRAAGGGHIYSRHAYGPGLLTAEGPVATDGNAGRPFQEAAYLRQVGIHTPMVITEAGANAGYQFPGVEAFMADVERYDQLCRPHDNIWGFCCWTYGGWRNGAPNIQAASAELAAYLRQEGGSVRPSYPAVAAPTAVAPQQGGETAKDAGTEGVAGGTDRRIVIAELGLNLRREPHTDAEIIRALPYGEEVEVLEDGPWALVRAARDTGYVFRVYLSPAGVTRPQPGGSGADGGTTGEVRFGMNVNPDAAHGNPVHEGALRGVDWVRFPFKLSARVDPAERGNLEAAFAQYDPIVRGYAEQDVNCLLVLNQETVGGNVPWQLTANDIIVHEYSDVRADWEDYAGRFAGTAAEIARHYRHLGLGGRVGFQIWNEGDQQNNPASAYLKPEHMAIVLKRAEEAIHQQVPLAPIVFNGMASGGAAAVEYLKQCQQALGGRLPVSAIGIHPYGRWVSGPVFPDWGFGRLEDDLTAYRQAFPGMRFWITEIGVAEDIELGPEHYPAIARYMSDVYSHVRRHHSDLIKVIIWFAWSDEMRNAGMVTRDGQPKAHIYPVFEQVRDRTLF